MPRTGGAIKAPKPKKTIAPDPRGSGTKPLPAPKPVKVAPVSITAEEKKRGSGTKGSNVGPPTLDDISKKDRIGGKNNPSKTNAKGNVVPKASSSKEYKKGFTSDKSYTKSGDITQAAAKKAGLDAKGVSVKPGPKKFGGGGGGGGDTRPAPAPRRNPKPRSGGVAPPDGGGGGAWDGGGGGGGGGRIGGGFVVEDTYTDPSDSFMGSFGEGGGQTGGSSNPLQSSSLDKLKDKDVESFVSGARKSKKQLSKRGTE